MNPDAIRFKSILKLREAYRHASCIMAYDGMTAAPRNAAKGAAQTSALLAAEERALTDNDAYAELCRRVFSDGEADALTRVEAERELRRVERSRRVPARLHAEFKRLTAEGFAKWQEAKAKDDHAVFAPCLDAIFAAAAEIASCAAPEKEPYAYWLDENEEGMTPERLDSFFGLIKRETVPLIKRIAELPKPENGFLHRYYPKAEQAELSRELMELMCIDPARGSLGEAEHPYTTFVSRDDVRMTTHYFERSLTANMFSILHEGGHATYELNIARELSGSPLAHGASAGLHESQSRFFENIIGRSRAFSGLIFPRLKARFPGQLAGVTEEEYFRAVNRVEPTLKRTEADELTYCLHVMIRCELERRMITGELSAAELPGEWNALYEKYLGITPPTDREGCLQDMHWGSGLIGYFPTYALGNAYGAQIAAAMREELDVDALVAKGRLGDIIAWLTERVYRFGGTKRPAEILASFGGGFEPGHYVSYLSEKYRAVYGLRQLEKSAEK